VASLYCRLRPRFGVALYAKKSCKNWGIWGRALEKRLAPTLLHHRPSLTDSLTDVERIPVLQVEVQMRAMRFIGLRAEHRGERLAGAVVHAT
jgi:hypothetical protein